MSALAVVIVTELAREYDEAAGPRNRAHRDMVIADRKAVAEHQRFLSQAIVHIRRELGLPFDAKNYLAHMEQSSVTVVARVRELLDQLDDE